MQAGKFTKCIFQHDRLVLVMLMFFLFSIGLSLNFEATVSNPFCAGRYGWVFYSVVRQLVMIGLGCLLFIGVQFVDLKKWGRWPWLWFAASLLLAFLPLCPGIGMTIGGAHRWIRTFGVAVNTGILVNLSFAFFLGAFLCKRAEAAGINVIGGNGSAMPPAGPPAKSGEETAESPHADFGLVALGYPLARSDKFLIILVTLLIALPLCLQPNIAAAALLLLTLCLFFFIVGDRTFAGIIGILFVSAALVYLGVIAISSPGKLAHYFDFLFPGRNHDYTGFTYFMSLYAVLKGGLWGAGVAGLTDNIHLFPEANKELIFALACYKWGLIGAGIIMLAFAALFRLILKSLSETRHRFHALLIAFLGSHFMVTTILAIAMLALLVPLHTTILPFLGYGGSQVIFVCLLMGLVFRELKQPQPHHEIREILLRPIMTLAGICFFVIFLRISSFVIIDAVFKVMSGKGLLWHLLRYYQT